MPYPDDESVPDYIKKYPANKRRQWRKVWNNVYERTGSEEKAFKAANAILKQEAMDMKTAEANQTRDQTQVRLDLLDSLMQVGKKLSKATLAKLKEVMDKLKELMDMDDMDDMMSAQAWLPAQEILLQELVAGEAIDVSIEELLSTIARAVSSDRALGTGYKYVVATMADWLVYCAEEWGPNGYGYSYYRVDWSKDEDGITLGDPEEVTIRKIVTDMDQALVEADLLGQARADVSDADKKRAAKEYGDVEYADPENKKYPIDTEKHVRAAWSYINMPKNAKFYSPAKLAKVKARIKRAAKKLGIEISEESQAAAVPVGHVIEQDNGQAPFLLQQSKVEISLVQDKGDGKGVVFGGVATHGNVLNDMGVLYPTELWESQMESRIVPMLSQGRLVGATWHPHTSGGRPRDPHVHELSHKFMEIEMDGDFMRFQAETIDTEAGRDLAGVLRAAVGLDMSTRATGRLIDGEWEDQAVKVPDPGSFELHGIDVVLQGASPGSAVEYARLQDASSGPESEDAMERDEIKQMIQDAIAAGNSEVLGKLQALEQKTEGSQSQAALSDEDRTLLQSVKEAQEAAIRTTARDAKVKEVMGAIPDTELPKQFRSTFEGFLQDFAQTAEEVEGKLAAVKSRMTPFLTAHNDMLSKGFYVPEYNDDGTEKGRLTSIAQGIDELVQKKVDQKMLVETGKEDFSNTAWVMRRILTTLAQERPDLAVGWMKMRNREITTLEQSKEWLLSQAGWQHLRQAGEMKTTDIAAAVPYVFPIVVDLYPQLIAMQLGTVQPLERSTGRVYFWKIHDQDNNLMSNVANFTGSYANDPGEKGTVKRLKGKITSSEVTCEIKKLGYDLSVEVLRHLRTDFGIDATDVLAQACADEIAREWNYNILAEMASGATAGNVNYGTAIPADASYDGEQWQKQIINHVQRARDLIYEQTFSDTAWIIGEPRQISRITWLAKEAGQYSGDGRGRIAEGVDIVGNLSTGEVLVKVGWWDTLLPDKLLVAGRGTTWPRTGYVIAPYLGLYVTPVWVDPATLDVEQSMMSELAHKMVNGDYFATVTIQEGTAGTPL